MRKLDLRPRRTVRVVLWTNEENGVAGAKAYRRQHAGELDQFILAIESDEGVFKPLGFKFAGSTNALERLRPASALLAGIGAGQLEFGAGGTDVSQLQSGGVPIMDLVVEGAKYFWYHHTEADTIDKLAPAEIQQCVAALAVMAYSVAEAPERLPR